MYSIAKRCRASISKHTLSIEISFGFPEVFGKQSLAGEGVLNMPYLTLGLRELGET